MRHPLRGLLIGPFAAVTGALGGTIVALGFAWMQQNAVMVHMPVSGGAALGALAGALCWWAGQARESKSE
jgi:predicted acyltransferase